MSILQKLYELQLRGRIPEYVPTNTIYEVVMGSFAYGANLDKGKKSDTDIYAIYLPMKEQLFPNLAGKVWGFDEFPEVKTYQITGIMVESEEFDISCYPITKFFHLAEQNNPNVIDALFVDFDCVRKLTNGIGTLIRDNRKLFLSKLVFNKFRGYAFSQLSKVRTIDKSSRTLLDFYKSADLDKLTTNREELREFGTDWKFIYHVVRLMLEAEQILSTYDLDLRRDGEFLKSIRQGFMSLEEILKWFSEKEKYLQNLYNSSTIPERCDKDKIRELLLNCLEAHYGSLGSVVYLPTENTENFIRELKLLMEQYKL